MEYSPYLKPMRPDALMRRPAPQAHFDAPRVKLVPKEPPADPDALHAPAFAPRPVRSAPVEEDLDQLLSSFLEEEADEAPADDPRDAVPTSKMPVPVCVPLFEEEAPKRHWWQRR